MNVERVPIGSIHVDKANVRSYGIVYLATNTANGKGYVGQTTGTLEARKAKHLRAAQTRPRTIFHRAIRKYGNDTFTWQVLMMCDSLHDLHATERAYIGILGTKKPNGYNIKDGGGGGHTFTGWHHTVEARRKISEAAKRRTYSPEQKQALRENIVRVGKAFVKGKPKSAEHRRKLSVSKTGKALSLAHKRAISEGGKKKIFSAEHRRALTNAMTGKPHPHKGTPHSPEAKRRMSEAHKGKTLSLEHRRKLSEARKGMKMPPRSAEHRKHMSEAQKGKKRGPQSAEHKRKRLEALNKTPAAIEHLRKLQEARKGKPLSAETRQRISEGHKRRVQSNLEAVEERLRTGLAALST